MRIDVLKYDPDWQSQFQEIESELKTPLDGVPYVSIEHVGSTSVPGLAAKPIIDIDVVVKPEQLEAVIQALVVQGGYAYMGIWGLPDRHVFKKAEATPPRNLYACIDGCQALRNHLAIRDICRRDVDIRMRYGNLKLELAKRDWQDVDGYSEAKSELLSWMLQEAGMSPDEISRIKAINERDPLQSHRRGGPIDIFATNNKK